MAGLRRLRARLLVELLLQRRVWSRREVGAGRALALIADERRHLRLDLRLVEGVVHDSLCRALLITHVHGLVQSLLLHQLLLFNSVLGILFLTHGLPGTLSVIDVVLVVDEHVFLLMELELLRRVLVEGLRLLTLRVEAHVSGVLGHISRSWVLLLHLLHLLDGIL